jgi:hypothetical protein
MLIEMILFIAFAVSVGAATVKTFERSQTFYTART